MTVPQYERCTCPPPFALRPRPPLVQPTTNGKKIVCSTNQAHTGYLRGLQLFLTGSGLLSTLKRWLRKTTKVHNYTLTAFASFSSSIASSSARRAAASVTQNSWRRLSPESETKESHTLSFRLGLCLLRGNLSPEQYS